MSRGYSLSKPHAQIKAMENTAATNNTSLAGLLQGPWTMAPTGMNEARAAVSSALAQYAAGHMPFMGTVNNAALRYQGDWAVIDVFGALTQRPGLLQMLLGGTSTMMVSRQLREASGARRSKGIILNFDSHGGQPYGIQELATQIRNTRQRMPVVAVVNSLAAAGAYWLASQASEFVITPGGEAGSVGVIAQHADYSRKLNKDGVKVTLITAGRFKGEGNPFNPLDKDAQANMQKRIDQVGDAMVAGIARGRGVAPGVVRAQFGEGRTVGAQQAVRRGMADRIATLAQVLAEKPRQRSTRTASATRAGLYTPALTRKTRTARMEFYRIQLADEEAKSKQYAQAAHQENVKQGVIIAAYHEAGHALVAIRCGAKGVKAQIRRDGSGGRVTWLNESLRAVHDTLAVTMAGPIAEGRHRRRTPETLQSWKEVPERCQSSGVSYTSRNSDSDYRAARSHATKLISQNWSKVDRLAQQLLVHATLNHKDIERIAR